jgi:hypothetical protein
VDGDGGLQGGARLKRITYRPSRGLLAIVVYILFLSHVQIGSGSDMTKVGNTEYCVAIPMGDRLLSNVANYFPDVQN